MDKGDAFLICGLATFIAAGFLANVLVGLVVLGVACVVMSFTFADGGGD
jgi:hypothetical protein